MRPFQLNINLQISEESVVSPPGSAGGAWDKGTWLWMMLRGKRLSLYSACGDSLEERLISHQPFIKGFSWPYLLQAHMFTSHRQVLKWRVPQFPAQAAAWRIPDGSATEQTSSDRQPEAIRGCLLCGEPTLQAKREPLSLSRTSARPQNDADRKMKLIRAL